jgi:hypothetical protein
MIAAISASANARSPMDHRLQSLCRSRITGAPMEETHHEARSNSNADAVWI